MSKKDKEIDVIETVNEVIENVEGEVTDMKEKKSVFTKIGEGLGKGVNAAGKVVKSKPAKIIGGISLAAAAFAAGYKTGKGGSQTCDDEAVSYDGNDFNEVEMPKTEEN